jgi:hypothetical protein
VELDDSVEWDEEAAVREGRQAVGVSVLLVVGSGGGGGERGGVESCDRKWLQAKFVGLDNKMPGNEETAVRAVPRLQVLWKWK